MIAALSGVVTEVLSQGHILIEVASLGIEYEIAVPDRRRPTVGEEVRLYIRNIVDTATAQTVMYGFRTEADRRFFDKLLGVGGIGAATALIVVSHFDPLEIPPDYVDQVRALPNIGPKRATAIEGVLRAIVYV